MSATIINCDMCHRSAFDSATRICRNCGFEVKPGLSLHSGQAEVVREREFWHDLSENKCDDAWDIMREAGFSPEDATMASVRECFTKMRAERDALKAAIMEIVEKEIQTDYNDNVAPLYIAIDAARKLAE